MPSHQQNISVRRGVPPTETEFKSEPTTDETAREVAMSDDQDISLSDSVLLVLAMYLADLLKVRVGMYGERRTRRTFAIIVSILLVISSTLSPPGHPSFQIDQFSPSFSLISFGFNPSRSP